MISSKKKLNVIFRRCSDDPQEKREVISSLRLIKSLALNYPLLHAWGFRQTAAISIITAKISNVVEILNCKGSIVLGQTFHEIKNGLHTSGKSLFIYQYSPSPNANEVLEYLLSVVKTGMLDSHPFKGIIVIVTNHADMPDSNRDCWFFEVEKTEASTFTIKDLIPDEKNLPLVLDTVKRTVQDQQDEFSTLKAAACCMFPDTEDLNSLEGYLDYINQLKAENDYLHDSSGLSNIFLQVVFSYTEAKAANIVELPELSKDAHLLDGTFFMNYEFLFISDATFKKLISEESSVGPNAFKKALKADKILIPEPGNSKSYETNMNYLVNGAQKRISMLRFDLEKMKNKRGAKLADYLSAIMGEGDESEY